MGLKGEDRLSDREKNRAAYHEAGHGLAALLLSGADPLSKVTIIARGRALGATEQLPAVNGYSQHPRKKEGRPRLKSLIIAFGFCLCY